MDRLGTISELRRIMPKLICSPFAEGTKAQIFLLKLCFHKLC